MESVCGGSLPRLGIDDQWMALLDWECSSLLVSAVQQPRRLPSDVMLRCVMSGRAIASGNFAKK